MQYTIEEVRAYVNSAFQQYKIRYSPYTYSYIDIVNTDRILVCVIVDVIKGNVETELVIHANGSYVTHAFNVATQIREQIHNRFPNV